MARKPKVDENGNPIEPTPKAPKEPKAPGVIDRLEHHLRNGGGNVTELAQKLASDFPEKTIAEGKGMTTTVRVQLGKKDGRVQKHGLIKEKVEGRGMVYSLPAQALEQAAE